MKKLLLAVLLAMTPGCTVHTMRTDFAYGEPVYYQPVYYSQYTPRRHVVYYVEPAHQCTNLVYATCAARGW